MEAGRTMRFASKTAIFVSVVVVFAGLPSATSARRVLSMSRAEAAARETVLEHPSYRKITSLRTGLVTRSCWRRAASKVRCSLYVVAPTPCALDTDAGGVCVQTLWERRWLVEVTRARQRAPTGRVLKISSGPSG
jgi:hypothetical protein